VSGGDWSLRTTPPVIVVNIAGRQGLVLLNSAVFGRWEDFVVDELLPFIDAEYRTIPLPQGCGDYPGRQARIDRRPPPK